MFTHAPPQVVIVQLDAHAPLTHICPAMQALLQAPQCAALLSVLVSQPLAAIASQLPKFGAQVTTPQAPAAQVCVATLTSAQARPQPPQFPTEVAVSKHASGMPAAAQLVWPIGQVGVVLGVKQLTAVGEVRSVVLPSPSWPAVLDPQQRTEPSISRAQVWL